MNFPLICANDPRHLLTSLALVYADWHDGRKGHHEVGASLKHEPHPDFSFEQKELAQVIKQWFLACGLAAQADVAIWPDKVQ